MSVPFILGENLVANMARWRIEEAANDYLAQFTGPGSPHPRVTGEIAETIARRAFTQMAGLNAPLSTSMLIALLSDANPEQRENLMQQLELKI